MLLVGFHCEKSWGANRRNRGGKLGVAEDRCKRIQEGCNILESDRAGAEYFFNGKPTNLY